MKIFKFGGASIKNAEGVKNIATVLQHEGVDNTVLILSAMGKMTNAFKKVVDAYFFKENSVNDAILTIKKYHLNIISDLDFDKKNEIFESFNLLFEQLSNFLSKNTSKDYNFIYDQVVSYGELLSTNIVSAYLTKVGVKNLWIDVRTLIKTDAFYRSAKVDWKTTEQQITTTINTSKITITQGFLGGNNQHTTTLGREGSDFSAAIFAYCLNAKSVTIWKDVEGVLNTDPRYFSKTQLLEQISYKEAIEMAFYGASVIHPKTLKPLENKLIPLYVRSFYNLQTQGTVVKKGIDLSPKTLCYILKRNQILISISALDFSFMVEHNLRDIFDYLHTYKLKVNLIQNSALSFSVCVDDKYHRFNDFYKAIKTKYNVSYNHNTTLYTIRHFNKNAIVEIENNYKILLKQTSRETVQFVVQ